MKEKEDFTANHLLVPFLPSQRTTGYDSIAHIMQELQKYRIGYAPWKTTYPSSASVTFSIAYDRESIFLQYDVEEDFIRAANGRANEPVYEDSCVEFFISLDGGETYYNFEFNCIGAVLGAYGASRQDRQFLPVDLVDQIECQCTIRRLAKKAAINWQLTVIIPLIVFTSHPSFSFSGKNCKANFYKCGDKLPDPHFLCWSPVENETPNFHLPQYFGTLSFATEEAGRSELLAGDTVGRQP
ncbi:MAG: hypothetical protein EOO10_24920 [Chitinophagaceae bacterium]|nr:MAG: hypothetical protein EOO10_24920 [Chitinophagaceae bacterium]